MWRNQAGIVVTRFLQVHLKLKSRLPRVGNGLGIKYIHGQGRLQAVSLFSSVSYARREKRGRQPEKKRIPVSRLQSRVCILVRFVRRTEKRETARSLWSGKRQGNFIMCQGKFIKNLEEKSG